MLLTIMKMMIIIIYRSSRHKDSQNFNALLFRPAWDGGDGHDHDVVGDFGNDYDVHGFGDDDGKGGDDDCDGHDIGDPEDDDD